MIETEIKLKINNITNKENIIDKLVVLGFVKKATFKEWDRYFDNEDGFIKKSDCALRIRQVTDLENGKVISQINFKGKKLDSISMTRPEFESDIEDSTAVENIINALGYKAVKPEVIKYRQEYIFENVTACIDSVENLGDFLELEIMVDDEAIDKDNNKDSNKDNENQQKAALYKIEEMLKYLGYSINDTMTTSYLSQLIKLDV